MTTKTFLPNTDPLEATLDSDREFFRRNPDREYRLRPMTDAELEELDSITYAWLSRRPRAFSPYVAVREVLPNLRIRAIGLRFAGTDCFSESDAANTWRNCLSRCLIDDDAGYGAASRRRAVR